MTKAISQLMGMVRYELRMQWRRRGMLVMMIGLLAAILLTCLIEKSVTDKIEYPRIAADMREQVARLQATLALLYTWPVGHTLLILSLPLVAAEAIPQDRHYGVRDLLDSLALDRDIYLAGKVLSVWAAVLIGLVAVAILEGWGGLLIFGPFKLDMYLLQWVIGLIPTGLFAAGMGALLAAGQPNRRRATFVGVAFAAYCVAMLITTSGTVWDSISLARPSLFLYLFKSMLLDSVVHYPPIQIPLALGLGAAQIVLVWLIVWAGLRWKENT